MAQAGFCTECGDNVWLTAEGACRNGHPPTCISESYDPDAPAPLQDRSGRRRRLWWVLIAGVVLVLASCAIVAVVVAPRLFSKGTQIADEWQTRLAADYPGWKPVGFNVQKWSGPGGSETTYQFTLVAPDGDCSVPVVYVATDGQPPVCQDEVLRPAGRYHERADALLEYLNSTYYSQGMNTTAVTSDEDGNVTVDWVKTKRFGPFTSQYGSYDELIYDEARGRWERSGGPS